MSLHTMAISLANSKLAERSLFFGNSKSQFSQQKSTRPTTTHVQASQFSCTSMQQVEVESLEVKNGRRQMILSIASVASAVSAIGSVSPNAEAADIIERFQRSEFLDLLKGKLRNAVEGNPKIATDLLKLAINDVITYDNATKSGGANGSIRFSEELSRPENAGLDAAVKFLEGVKADVDAESKGGPVSWADLIQFGGQAAAKYTFLVAAIKKAGGDVSKGQKLAQAFGSSSQWGYFEKYLGRRDATEADPSGRVPVFADASVAELKEKFAQYGLKARQLAVLSAVFGPDQLATEAKFSEDPEVKPYVDKYQRSRQSVSQTDYEVDLISAYTKLSVLGASINYEAYTYVKPRPKLRF